MLRLLWLLLLLPLVAQAGCYRSAEWYTVKPNGKLLTRPSYSEVEGKLVKAKERATVGATCGKPYKPSGRDLWASYDSTGLLALCVRR